MATQYRNFEAVITKARLACFNSGHRIDDHFADVSKMIATYFAIQTRRQELADESIEEERRVLLRDEMRRHNAQLADALVHRELEDRQSWLMR